MQFYLDFIQFLLFQVINNRNFTNYSKYCFVKYTIPVGKLGEGFLMFI